jgi:hypothetical protein
MEGRRMNMEDQIRDAVVAELQRQGEASEGKVKVQTQGDNGLRIEGTIELDSLAMAVAGAVAGGP